MEGEGREEGHHHLMRSTHPYLFQRASARRRETGLHCEGKGKVSQPYEQSSLAMDVSLHRGIPPGRPPDLELVRGIFPFGSPLLGFGDLNSFEGEFGMGDIKVVGSRMRGASHARSPTLSLGRIDP